MKIHYDINLQGDFIESGLGLLTMKAAYGWHINGVFSYTGKDSAMVRVEGTPESLHSFISWLQNDASMKIISSISAEPGRMKYYRDFMII